ncbi:MULTISPECIES: LysR family transcriptional regulator [unclassified Streptomyces]|uniref:LysR family transcriptional regulator n=1 Tax=unclassified Streptomyces TaxID=2593676 RepID=UPI00224D2AFA|nr:MULTISPECIES: LysR family transcriptional regulator [unclassified Streptomyces]MCX5329820.1 LysR family transcriptional regulator [Streptomyces sp. NBC_00140]MCX5359235.1 LysR family transcriptional regulator [Streptomyces sp. NBC_00124]
MDVDLRQLRCLVAIVDEGTFTDAALALGVSQAAVSRTLASFERALGVRLLRRTSREVTPTPTGLRVLAHARRVLAEVDDLVRDATSGHAHLRMGYAWSALGRHTLAFQRRWSRERPETDLHLVRVNSATAGLAEGACDLAVVRRPVDERRFESVIVGLERRLCAMAADDPLARRRSVRLADLAGRVLLVDRRTGTATPDLWPPEVRPATEETHDVDDWLNIIATGRCVGMTPESTANQYPRPGVVYRPVRDGEPIAVRLAWWRDDPHPATQAVMELLTSLYREG